MAGASSQKLSGDEETVILEADFANLGVREKTSLESCLYTCLSSLGPSHSRRNLLLLCYPAHSYTDLDSP